MLRKLASAVNAAAGELKRLQAHRNGVQRAGFFSALQIPGRRANLPVDALEKNLARQF